MCAPAHDVVVHLAAPSAGRDRREIADGFPDRYRFLQHPGPPATFSLFLGLSTIYPAHRICVGRRDIECRRKDRQIARRTDDELTFALLGHSVLPGADRGCVNAIAKLASLGLN